MKKKKKIHHDIVKRWEGNPMIVIEDLSFKCNDILNASAFKIKDEYVLLITIENLDGSYSIYPAKSADGYDFDIAGPRIGLEVFADLHAIDSRQRNVQDDYGWHKLGRLEPGIQTVVGHLSHEPIFFEELFQ